MSATVPVDPLGRADPRPGLFYGWVMVPVAALLHAGTGAGQTYGVSVFKPHIEAALGVSDTALSATYGAASFLAALPLPVVGHLADRLGLRAVGVGVVLGLSVGCVVTGSAVGLVTAGVGFFLLRMLGQGALTLVAGNTPAMWSAASSGSPGGWPGWGRVWRSRPSRWGIWR